MFPLQYICTASRLAARPQLDPLDFASGRALAVTAISQTETMGLDRRRVCVRQPSTWRCKVRRSARKDKHDKAQSVRLACKSFKLGAGRGGAQLENAAKHDRDTCRWAKWENLQTSLRDQFCKSLSEKSWCFCFPLERECGFSHLDPRKDISANAESDSVPESQLLLQWFATSAFSIQWAPVEIADAAHPGAAGTLRGASSEQSRSTRKLPFRGVSAIDALGVRFGMSSHQTCELPNFRACSSVGARRAGQIGLKCSVAV